MKYENKKNGMVATFISEDEVRGTTKLEYEDGKSFDVSNSTLKRWWKKIEDEQEVAGDGTPLEEVGKEIAQQAKEKAEQASKKKELDKKAIKEAVAQKKAEKKPKKDKKEAMPIEEAHKLIIEQIKKAGFDYVITEKVPKSVHILINGKKSSGVYVGGSKCVLGLPEKLVPKGYKADRVRNCPISHSFDIDYKAMDKISEILGKVKTIEQEDK